ncbi:MAG: iron-containing alcohol dehydrogenase [Bacillota bacterium]|nr:iron-containing alcohol dehydrogenase [Bacillota bacterium]
MQNFVFHSPTKIIFGKDTEKLAGSEVKNWGGTNVLIVYGGQSALKSGLIDRIKASVEDAGLEYSLWGGVKPNPLFSDVKKGIEFAKEKKVDFILAVGGGSVMDTAKAISVGVIDDGELWDIFMRKRQPKGSLPVGAVVTIPASGSEMSSSCVVTRDEDLVKRGFFSEENRMQFAITNPELTYTLPEYQTACGIVDIMMHTLDRYFSPDEYSDLSDGFAEALLRTTIKNGAAAMDDPESYDARAELMWAGTLSHNDITGVGRNWDFAPHQFEHELSGLYDVAHGAGLAAIWGSWARYVCEADPLRFARYGVNVFGLEFDYRNPLNTAYEAINATEEFFSSIGMPITMSELLGFEVSDEDIEIMAEKCTNQQTRTIGTFMVLDKQDIIEVYRMAR